MKCFLWDTKWQEARSHHSLSNICVVLFWFRTFCLQLNFEDYFQTSDNTSPKITGDIFLEFQGKQYDNNIDQYQKFFLIPWETHVCFLLYWKCDRTALIRPVNEERNKSGGYGILLWLYLPVNYLSMGIS